MRISDWSSDVCSSDLAGAALGLRQEQVPQALRLRLRLQLGHDRRAAPAVARVVELLAEHRLGGVDVLVHEGADTSLEIGGARAQLGDHRELLGRSEEHTSELQSLMSNSYAVFCLKKKKKNTTNKQINTDT